MSRADPAVREGARVVYAVGVVALAAAMLALFGLAHALDVPLLSDDAPQLGEAGPLAAIVSFALLAADVVLPVPSSGVMVANGALFGWPAAAALSVAGSVAAALLGGAIGRRGGAMLESRISPERRTSVVDAIERRGAVAIVVTRPIPIVAETTAIVAGAAGMSYRHLGVAAAIGALPPSVAYGLAGAVAGGYGSPLLVLAGVLALSAVVWRAGRRWPLVWEGPRWPQPGTVWAMTRTWPVASGSLLLGFAVAQATGVRPLGGIVLIAGCGWCGMRWLRTAGAARTAVLVAVYVGAFALSHVVADTLGTWGAVLLAAAVAGLAAYLLADARAIDAGARAGDVSAATGDAGAGTGDVSAVSPARAAP